MFTGLIQELGTVERFESTPGGARLHVVLSQIADLVAGESVAINGVCLTALTGKPSSFAADLSSETLDRTSLKGLASGARVNVERALRLGDRLGGHLVQGHVDATATVLDIEKQGDFRLFHWSLPPAHAELLVDKGSIAVDGISLTVVSPTDSSFSAAVIPETLARTNLGSARVGDSVNLEFDMMARYAQRLISPYLTALSR